MRKQLRAADLYQSYCGVEPLPVIRGIHRYALKANYNGGLKAVVEFITGETISEDVNWTSSIRRFVKRVNSCIAEMQYDLPRA